MPRFTDSFDAMLHALEALGPPFPPASTNEPGITFAVITASLLSRMFAPRQARTTWEAFHAAGFNSPEIVANAKLSELVEKTKNLPAPLKPLSEKTLTPLYLLSKCIVDFGGLNALDEVPTEELRDELLMMPGISPAMADAVLLYGLKRPTYPADGPTYRILARHGWIEPTTDYEEVRATIEQPAYGDVVILSALAAWLNRAGELYCKAKVSMCEGCPLAPFLPDGGPCETTE